MQSLSYSPVSSVVKQCNCKRHINKNALRGNHGSETNDYHNNRFPGQQKMTPEQNKSETVKYPCYICTKYENWKNKHLADGSLPSGVQSVEKSANNSNNDPVHSNKKSKDSQHA